MREELGKGFTTQHLTLMFFTLLGSCNMFAVYWFCYYNPHALGSWCAHTTAGLSPGTTQGLPNYLFFLPFFCLFSSSFPFMFVLFSLFSDSFSSLEEAFLSLSPPSFFPSFLFIRWFFLLDALLCWGQFSSSLLSFSSLFFCDFFLSSLFALTISLRVCFLDLLSFTSSSAVDKKKKKQQSKTMKQQALWETLSFLCWHQKDSPEECQQDAWCNPHGSQCAGAHLLQWALHYALPKDTSGSHLRQ